MELFSTPINEIAAALVAAQASIPALLRDKTATVVSQRTGSKYTYKYADLSDVIEAIKAVLAANGLSVTQQLTVQPDGSVLLVTRLLHTSGQWLASHYPIQIEKEGKDGKVHLPPQEVGALITYARRYSLCAIVGIAAEEDTDRHGKGGNGRDGNDASGKVERKDPPPPPAPKVDEAREGARLWLDGKLYPALDDCGIPDDLDKVLTKTAVKTALLKLKSDLPDLYQEFEAKVKARRSEMERIAA